MNFLPFTNRLTLYTDGFNGDITLQGVRDAYFAPYCITLNYARAWIRCTDLRSKIQTITDGEYASARRLVDSLRAELGQPPLPSLQETIEEKASA